MRSLVMKPFISRKLSFSSLRAGVVLAELIGLGALAAACSGGADPSGSGGAEPVASARASLAGVDGALTVSTAGTVVNRYTALAANVAVGATTVQVASVAALAVGADALAPGDLILIAQMQGAALETTFTDQRWGSVTAVNGAGLYELVEVLAVNAGTNTITLSCATRNAYVTAGVTQVVRVPQHTTVTVSKGGSITAPAWNGTVGGIVALHASGAVTLAGDINASALGFRGGPIDNSSEKSGTDVASFVSIAATDGARKGEGIAGLRVEFGRAPAANGGGGGNSHNGGGGGGSNARSGKAWTGQGFFDLTVKGGAAAWPLDPNYSAFNSEGGGRGGYSYSANDLNATKVGPDKGAWGGNERRDRGGLGGHGLDNDVATRVFMGGGGGAGDANNGHAGRGGNGGGFVLLSAGSVAGGGRIVADGENGIDSDSTSGGAINGDAPGGGGGGGSIVVRAATVTGIVVQARGGLGGDQIVTNGDEGEGPGGGGGGGFVSVTGAGTVEVTGGRGGTTTSPALTEFPSNGATSGSPGVVEIGAGAAAGIPYCADNTIPNTRIDSGPTGPTSDPTATFTFSSTNDPGATFECSLDGVAFNACTSPDTTATLPDGAYTFHVRARDAVGNVDPSPATRSFTVDTAPPDTRIDSGPNDPSASRDATFTFSAPGETGGVTFECSVDSAAFSACTTPLDLTGLVIGSHNIRVQAVDAAGNVDPTPAEYDWDITGAADSDIDGISDDDETTVGTDPNDADTDDDGVIDGNEVDFSDDTDGDGLINARDPDSDNDGLFDGTEVGLGCDDPATDLTRGLCRPDADTSTTTSPIDADSDDGGVIDGSEDSNLDGAINGNETDPNLGVDDRTIIDSDGDGLSDDLEGTLHSDPNDQDSDDDGVLDGEEPNPSADGDQDGLVDVNDVDSDDDGLLDGTELGRDCLNGDTNAARGHCRADADPSTTTSSVDRDSDQGGVTDGNEDGDLDGAIDPGETDPTSGNGADDGDLRDRDADGDGLSDETEGTLGSDPNDADSDDDGLLDGSEPNPGDDHDDDGRVNILDSDSDGDRLFDGTEAGKDCNNSATDLRLGQCRADADAGSTTTRGLNRDTDYGGVIDGDEDSNLNGARDTGERDPLDPADDEDDSGGGAGAGAGGEAGAGANGGAAGAAGADTGGTGGTAGGGGTGGSGATSSGGGGTTGGGDTSGGTGTGGTAATGGGPASGGSAVDEHVVILGGGLCSFRAVPESSAWSLLGLAGLALAWVRRRK